MGLRCETAGPPGSPPTGPIRTFQLAKGNTASSGVPEPQLPKWDPKWSTGVSSDGTSVTTGLQQYHTEMEDFNKKVLDYIRRKVDTAVNQNNDPTVGTVDVITSITYNKSLKRLMATTAKIKGSIVSTDTVVVLTPALLSNVVKNVDYDGGTSSLLQDIISNVYVFEAGSESDMMNIACLKPCDTVSCPDLSDNPFSVSHSIDAGPIYSSVIELNTNTASSFLFDGDSDDITLLIKNTDTVTLDFDRPNKVATFTMPAKYVMFRDTTGQFSSTGSTTITDGTNSVTILSTTSDSDPIKHVAGMPFTSQLWTTPVSKAMLNSLGLVDSDGIARLKFVSFGDNGICNVTNATCA